MATYALLLVFISFAIIITISLGFPSGTVIITNHDLDVNLENLTMQDKQKLYRINQLTALKFKCSPRPRSFDSKQLFKEEISASMIVSPNNYVLHRCEQSGCCSQSYDVCTEVKTKDVVLMFRFHNNVRLNEEPMYKSKIVSNHTECRCIDRSKRLPHDLGSLDASTSTSTRNSKPILFIFVFIVKTIDCYLGRVQKC